MNHPIIVHDFSGWWYGGIPTRLKNDGVRQVGVLFPTEWTNKSHVPNHQSNIYIYTVYHWLDDLPMKNKSPLKIPIEISTTIGYNRACCSHAFFSSHPQKSERLQHG